MNRRAWSVSIATVVVGFCAFVGFGVLDRLEVVQNTTPSSPLGIYVLDHPATYRIGERISACLPEAALRILARAGDAPPTDARSDCPHHVERIIKRIVALPGARVTVAPYAIVVEGRPVPMTRPLPGLPTPAPFTVPRGTVVGVGDVPDSFDSRYFGPVVPLARATWVLP